MWDKEKKEQNDLKSAYEQTRRTYYRTARSPTFPSLLEPVKVGGEVLMEGTVGGWRRGVSAEVLIHSATQTLSDGLQ